MMKAYIHTNSRDSRDNGVWNGSASTEGNVFSTQLNCRSILSKFRSKYTKVSLKGGFFNLEINTSHTANLTGIDAFGLIGLNHDGANIVTTDTSTASRSVMKLFADGNFAASTGSGVYTHNYVSLSVGGNDESGVIFETEFLRNNMLGIVLTFNMYAGSFTVTGRIAELQFLLQLESVEDES